MDTNDFKGAFSPRRLLGKTGFRASLLGIGDVADRAVALETCVATVRRAMDAGLNVIDTAPGYEDGYSEEIVGQALKGRRDGMFLIDKIDHMDRPVAAQVDTSLQRLKVEFTDAFVLHGVSTDDDWAGAAAPGGAMEQLDACRSAGKLRFRGISSHNPGVLQAAIASGLCDLVLFPLGAGCALEYATQVLPLARAHDVGAICFKAFGAGKLLADTTGYNQPMHVRPRGKMSSGGGDHAAAGPQLLHMSVTDCLHYTLTYDPDVALLGLSYPNEQDAAFQAALEFVPLAQTHLAQLRADAQEALDGKGPCWWNPA